MSHSVEPNYDGRSREYYAKYSGIKEPRQNASFSGIRRFVKTIGLEFRRVGHLFYAAFKGKLEWENRKGLTKHLYNELKKNESNVGGIHEVYWDIWEDREANYNINRKYQLLHKLKTEKNVEYVYFSKNNDPQIKFPDEDFKRCLYLSYNVDTARCCVTLVEESKLVVKEEVSMSDDGNFMYDGNEYKDIRGLLMAVAASKEELGGRPYFYNTDTKVATALMANRARPRTQEDDFRDNPAADYIHFAGAGNKSLKAPPNTIHFKYDLNREKNNLFLVITDNEGRSTEKQVQITREGMSYNFELLEKNKPAKTKELIQIFDSLDTLLESVKQSDGQFYNVEANAEDSVLNLNYKKIRTG